MTYRAPTVLFAVLAHRSPGQLAHLSQKITRLDGSAQVLIHYDRSSSEPITSSWSSWSGNEQVEFLPRPRAISWGDGTDVLAFLDLMRRARYRRAPWVVFLSGQDYPLRPTEELVELLTSSGSDVHMDIKAAGAVDGWPVGEATARYGYRHAALSRLPSAPRAVATKLARPLLARRPGPGQGSRIEAGATSPRVIGMRVGEAAFLGVRHSRWGYQLPELFCGSQWFAASAAAVAAILDFCDDNPAFVATMLRTVLPDEAVFQTIVRALPTLSASPGLHAMAFDGPRATNVTVADVAMYAAGPASFCRKVDGDADPAVVEALDELLRQRRR